MRCSNPIKKFLFATLFVCAGCISWPALAEAPAPNLPQEDVLEHLEDVIAWRRNLISLETLPKNSLQILLKKNLRSNAVKILQSNFDFARAQAAIPVATPDIIGPPKEQEITRNQQILQRLAEVDATLARLQDEIANLSREISRTRANAAKELRLRREQLQNELKLAQVQKEVLGNVIGVFSNEDNEDNVDLGSKIDNLLQALPDLQTNATPVTTAATTTASPPSPEELRRNGIMAMIDEMLSVYRRKKEINGMISETRDVQENASSLIGTMRKTMQELTSYGNMLAQEINNDTIETRRKDIDSLVLQYKQISAAIIPLGQGNRLMDASIRNLDEWNGSLDRELRKILQSFSLQLVILFIAILIPILLSETMRRVTKRYVADTRRQRQLSRARRVIFTFVILIIILLNLVTEFRSLATYVGFVTAGLAVALQNVILSVVAHFYFFGRFGVRIGDRITVGNVTGDVYHIGITRLHLMEVAGPEFDLQPTGKVVSFPNSILFQPNAFSKNVPGAQHFWEEIKFLIEPGADYALVTKKITEAVNIVFSQYHDMMQSHQAALRGTTQLHRPTPAPKVFTHFSESGFLTHIRYPIDAAQRIEASQRISQQIVDVLKNEPSLQLVNGTPPRIIATGQ